jgi:hypothetical protein
MNSFEKIMVCLSISLVAILLLCVVKAGDSYDRQEARWDSITDAFSNWFLMPPKIIEKTTTEKAMCSTATQAMFTQPTCAMYDSPAGNVYCMLDYASPGVYMPGARACYNGTKLMVNE